jgi:hypothetical protein
MYDTPTKNKRRAKRRALKTKHRSAPAKALEDNRYRQRIIGAELADDDSWKEDLKEYYLGTRDLEERTSTEEDTSSNKSVECTVRDEDRLSSGELVEVHKTRG